MTSNFRKDDPILGTVDLDDAYLTDASLLDYFVGNRIFTAGAAAFGTNGQSNTLSRSSPVQVGSLTTWKAVSGGFAHYHATKTDGTLWAWGYNDVGNLGIGNTVARSSPVQVGLLTNWKSIGARAGTSNCGAIKTDGTLWMWGVGTSGQLGLGNATSRSSPVQVGSLTNWKQLAVGNGQTLCVKTDGTLWAWGSGQNGALGLGDVIARSSPVQVGSLTNWKQVGGTLAAITFADFS
jgi:alpha-tubulin suppressor-like RCC1 family protein